MLIEIYFLSKVFGKNMKTSSRMFTNYHVYVYVYTTWKIFVSIFVCWILNNFLSEQLDFDILRHKSLCFEVYMFCILYILCFLVFIFCIVR